MWLWHCSAKSFGPGYYFFSLCGVCAIICAGRSWQEGPAPASLMRRGKPSSVRRRRNQSHQACPKYRMIINIWGKTLWWCKLAKALQRFAKEHQRMISLISFTYEKTLPWLAGAARARRGAGDGRGHGRRAAIPRVGESEGCSASTVQKAPACAFRSSHTSHNSPAVLSLSVCRSVW